MGNNAVLFGGNWNEGANSGSRCSNWNNSPTNSNNNISARGVCEDMKRQSPALCMRQGAAGRPLQMWSAVRSRFGKHPWGFGETTSTQRKLGKVGSGF
jgi:hypothetical protein